MEGGVDGGGGQKTRGAQWRCRRTVIMAKGPSVSCSSERKQGGGDKKRKTLSSSFCHMVPERMNISKRTEIVGVPSNKRVKEEPDNEWVSTVHTTVSMGRVMTLLAVCGSAVSGELEHKVNKIMRT